MTFAIIHVTMTKNVGMLIYQLMKPGISLKPLMVSWLLTSGCCSEMDN